jgi:hypothetical protein
MRSLVLRSLLVALLIGPLITFVSVVTSTRTDLEAFMKSREVKFTRYQWLRESIGYAYFWKEIARSSLGPCIGIFLGCLVVGKLERRYSLLPTADNS